MDWKKYGYLDFLVEQALKTEILVSIPLEFGSL